MKLAAQIQEFPSRDCVLRFFFLLYPNACLILEHERLDVLLINITASCLGGPRFESGQETCIHDVLRDILHCL